MQRPMEPCDPIAAADTTRARRHQHTMHPPVIRLRGLAGITQSIGTRQVHRSRTVSPVGHVGGMTETKAGHAHTDATLLMQLRLPPAPKRTRKRTRRRVLARRQSRPRFVTTHAIRRVRQRPSRARRDVTPRDVTTSHRSRRQRSRDLGRSATRCAVPLRARHPRGTVGLQGVPVRLPPPPRPRQPLLPSPPAHTLRRPSALAACSAAAGRGVLAHT